MQFDYAHANPNLKALRRILYALLTAVALCFGITLTLIARTRPPQHQTPSTPARCACGGQCARSRAK
jgi:hypothetical protein